MSRAHAGQCQTRIGRGAELLLGGDPFGPTGLCLPPHVLTGTNDVATAREEVFGPVITIRADDETHALRLANDIEYGLSSACGGGKLPVYMSTIC